MMQDTTPHREKGQNMAEQHGGVSWLVREAEAKEPPAGCCRPVAALPAFPALPQSPCHRPSRPASRSAMGAVGSKRSKNICITAVSGMAKNIPTMPHIMPQTMRLINTVAGCRFNEPF